MFRSTLKQGNKSPVRFDTSQNDPLHYESVNILQLNHNSTTKDLSSSNSPYISKTKQRDSIGSHMLIESSERDFKSNQSSKPYSYSRQQVSQQRSKDSLRTNSQESLQNDLTV